MKTTQYFEYTRKRPDRESIKDEWIENVIKNPIRNVNQADGRVKLWGRIEGTNKVLRVILLEDSETIYYAFYDRSFREK